MSSKDTPSQGTVRDNYSAYGSLRKMKIEIK